MKGRLEIQAGVCHSYEAKFLFLLEISVFVFKAFRELDELSVYDNLLYLKSI